MTPRAATQQERGHQGGEPLPARHDRRGAGRGDDRRDRRGRRPARRSSTAPICRTTATCGPSGARRSWSRPTRSWCGCACRAASARPRSGWRWTGSPTSSATDAAAHHPPGLPVPRRDQEQPQADDAGDQRGAAGHRRGLRRRQSQRDVQPEPAPVAGACGGARAGARDQRPPDAAHRRLSRDLARRREGGRHPGGGGADLRPPLPAAQVQDRGRGAAAQRRRRVRPGPGLHRDHRSGGRGGRLQRHGRRRHGHDPRRARDLPAHRRRHGLLPARAGGRGRRAGRDACSATSAIAPTASTPGSNTRSRIAGWTGSAPRSSGGSATRSRSRGRSQFDRTGDRYGWVEDHAGRWHYTLFVENGRVKDSPERPMKTGLRCDRARSTRATSA